MAQALGALPDLAPLEGIMQLPKMTVHTYSAQQFQFAIHYIQND